MRRIDLGLLGVMAFAVALRLVGLWSFPLEQDEMYTLRDALAFGQELSFRPAYFFLLHHLLGFVPPDPLWLRLPAFLFGLIGVWLTFELGKRWFGRTAGLVAALLVALSPWHIYASQLARYWSLVYALAAGALILLPRAHIADRIWLPLLTLGVLTMGVLAHPVFAFPFVGVGLALFAVSESGELRLSPPSRKGWAFLWGPLLLAAVAAVALIASLIGEVPLNPGRRPLVASLRLWPAIVQWLEPAVVIAAAGAAAWFILDPGPRDRRFAAALVLGAGGTALLLLVVSFAAGVYADYAIAMLPLVFVSVGGLVQRVGEATRGAARQVSLASVLVLSAAILPQTLSHLSDGTRFDHREAYAYLRENREGRFVIGWPWASKDAYGPAIMNTVEFTGLVMDPAWFDGNLTTHGTFWVVASFRRYGMVEDSGREVAGRLDRHCRRILVTERPRFDFRRYRVELHLCGDPSRVPLGSERLEAS